jgi:hypothetical protein
MGQVDTIVCPQKEEQVGYKVFVLDKLGLYPLYQGIRDKPVLVNEWLNEGMYAGVCPVEIFSWNGQAYPRGWHIFPNIEDAVQLAYIGGKDGRRRRTVREVKYRQQLATGKSLSTKTEVVVAKEIFVGDHDIMGDEAIKDRDYC